MSDILIKIINMSITASYLILAVVILRLLLHKAPKWIRMILWGLVGIRLVLPFSIESEFSFLPEKNPIGINPAADTVTKGMNGTFLGFSDVSEARGAMAQNAVGKNVTDMAEGIVQNGGMPITTILTIIWLVGIAVMLVYCMLSYVKLKRRVYDAILYQGGRTAIFQSEKVTSPFVLGFCKPRIYLPFHLEAEDMDFVIAHEKAHISRGDHWIKLIGFVILAVYWFHPLVWLSYILMCRDIELACDEMVIKEMDMQSKKAYAQALVKCSAPYRRISACPLAFGEVGVKKRIMNVLHYKKPAFWIVLVSLVLCGVVAVGFLTNPKEQSANENEALPQQSEDKETQEENEPGQEDESLQEDMSGSQKATVEGLTSPPMMVLQDSLSSTMNYYYVTSGTYSWNYQTENPEEMRSVEASGPFPTIAVKGEEENWLKLVDYNGIDYASYHAGFEVEPDRISIKEYDLLELGNMEPEVLSQTTKEDAYFLELRPRRIYEVTAEWDEEHLESNGFYGSAVYIFATDNDAVSLSGTENEESAYSPLITDQWTPDVNTLDGVELVMEKYSYTGGDLEMSNNSGKDLEYGEWFVIQQKVDGAWYSLKYHVNLGFNDIAYILPDGETSIKPVRWDQMYGELPPGEYRIVTQVDDVRSPGNYEKYYLADEFEINASY